MDSKKERKGGKITRQQKREEVKREKILNVITEIIPELLASEETVLKAPKPNSKSGWKIFKTPKQIENLLKRVVTEKLKESGIKGSLSPAEMIFFKRLAVALAKRDLLIFAEYCHRTRNELTNIGGFANRLDRATKKAAKAIIKEAKRVQQVLSELGELTEMTKTSHKEANIILKEVRKAGKKVERTEKKLPRL